MPVPQIVTPNEAHAHRLALAITRLTGDPPFMFATSCDGKVRYIVATADIDQAELNELLFVVEHLPAMHTTPLLR
ncbi:MAG: hypothetical protein IH609_11920 [Dehalococcoidia bacterium]|nr:hypothetical protein [Dehalococcoidia bacterium]